MKYWMERFIIMVFQAQGYGGIHPNRGDEQQTDARHTEDKFSVTWKPEGDKALERTVTNHPAGKELKRIVFPL